MTILTLIRSAAASAILALGLATSASASVFVQTADISIGSTVNATQILLLDDTAEFTFTALEDLAVGQISLGGTGSATALNLILSGLTFPASNNFDFVFAVPGSTFAGSILSGFELLAGESFTIFWSANGATSASVSAFFETMAPAPIPLPAGLPLLLGAVAVLGLARRKA